MKSIKLTFAICSLVFFMSCDNLTVEKTVSQESAKEESLNEEETLYTENINVDSLVAAANAMRAEIENADVAPMEVSTDGLKEKIKQKWEKIHFYTLDGNLVRIKTYPHENITNRTEEFYLEKGELFLAVIEDDGTGERGKSSEEIDKMYYYEDGELVHEIHKTEEREYSMRKSDAEELQTEVREYIDIYQSRFQD